MGDFGGPCEALVRRRGVQVGGRLLSLHGPLDRAGDLLQRRVARGPGLRRDAAEDPGDIVEEVKLIDEFTNPKKGKTSHCYRIVYRSMESSLTDEEINSVQDDVRRVLVDELKVELR